MLCSVFLSILFPQYVHIFSFYRKKQGTILCYTDKLESLTTITITLKKETYLQGRVQTLREGGSGRMGCGDGDSPQSCSPSASPPISGPRCLNQGTIILSNFIVMDL